MMALGGTSLQTTTTATTTQQQQHNNNNKIIQCQQNVSSCPMCRTHTRVHISPPSQIFSPYLQILQLSLKVFIICIKVFLPVLQRIIGTLLYVVHQQAEAVVVGVDAFDVRETERLVGTSVAKKVCDVVNPVEANKVI